MLNIIILVLLSVALFLVIISICYLYNKYKELDAYNEELQAYVNELSLNNQVVTESKKVYKFSFKAKLLTASDEIKDFYNEVINETAAYKKIKNSISFNHVRIYKGRETLLKIFFKGKKLCLAYKLEPSNYLNTKYVFSDISNVKKYVDTPLMIKITSKRKMKYSLELLNEMLNNYTEKANNYVKEEISFEEHSLKTMLDKGLIKEQEVKIN